MGLLLSIAAFNEPIGYTMALIRSLSKGVKSYEQILVIAARSEFKNK